MATAWKKPSFTLSERPIFHFVDNLLIVGPRILYAYADNAFSKWDIAVEVCELVF